ncbi:Nup133 N terminal like-domain-containing protein [Fennellomyces sp. T-0311]|nr:Nup133 N terminal like-domain-containing protein [Fennellomyces sp. T-0311]
MLDQKFPEQKVQAAHKASDTLERIGLVDNNIPNIGDLFTASSSGLYNLPERQAVQPFLPKHAFTLPPVALEQIKNWKLGDAAGILPEINRAYFAVENRLYLWDYVEKKDVNTYEETDRIVGVGLVNAKADIFNPEITHVLVVATTTRVSVIAVAFKKKQGEPHSLTFYRTEIFTSSSGAQMKTIIGTKNGRIFMLSELGDVWELEYRREEGWFTSRCSKKILSSMATSFFGTTHDPCIDIAVDEEGRVLYRLFESSSIQVSYLGDDGLSYTNIAKNTKINDAARLMSPSSPFFEGTNFKISSIHSTTRAEARAYQLVAVTSTGCRLYFTHFKYGANPPADGRPTTLELVHVRTPPAVQQTSETRPFPTVTKSLYKNGVLLLVDKLSETQQSIITACPNVGLMATQGRQGGFGEFSNRLEAQGQILGIAEMPGTPFKLNELASQPSEPARHFLIFSTYGMSVVVKQRPVDMLQNLLTSVGPNVSAQSSDFLPFFEIFGLIHSCALCFNLACHTSNLVSGIELQASDAVSIPVVKGATLLLETLGQSPSVLSTPPAVYTNRHDGLVLFINRLIAPFWNQKIVKESVQGKDVKYSTVVSRNELISTQQTLRKLQGFMDLNVSVYPQLEPQTAEEHSLRELYELVVLISEAISFLLFLLDSDASKIIKNLKPESQARFKAYTYKDLLTSGNGQALASELSMAMIDETMARYANMDIVIDVLEQRCGSFCNGSDVILYKAIKQIDAAKSEANTMPSRDALTESLKLLKRIAIHIPYEKLQEIAKDYSSQGALVLAVELVLTCAKARDPHNLTTAYLRESCPPNDPRADLFNTKQKFYDCVFQLLKEALAPSSSATQKATASQKDQAFQTAFSFDDIAFHYYIYEKFVEEKLGQHLIRLNPPHIEVFLRHEPVSLERYELLADYYRLNEEYDEAANVLQLLGRLNIDISIDKRLEYFTRANVCAKSVTAPSKEFEMRDLQQRLDIWIKQLQEEKQLQMSTA